MAKAIKFYPPRQILAATDLGEASKAVMRQVEIFKSLFKSEATLLYAQHFDVPPYFTESQISFFVRELKAGQKTARKHIERWARQFSEEVPKILVREDPPAEAILSGAQEEQSDMIIIGTHGRNWIGRLWLGSVAENVIRQASIPVMIVPPKSNPGSIEKVVVLIDPENAGSTPLDYALCLASDAKARLVILRMADGGKKRPPRPLGLKKISAQCEIDEVVLEGDPAEAILRTDNDWKPSLIVMGSTKSPAAFGASLSSVTAKVMHGTTVPLLIIPTRQKILIESLVEAFNDRNPQN